MTNAPRGRRYDAAMADGALSDAGVSAASLRAAALLARAAGGLGRAGAALGTQRRRLGFLLLTLAFMLGFYALLFHPYAPGSLPARCLGGYLELTARASAAVLRLLGEPAGVTGSTVLGRFPFEVVLDCGALDAQALFAAAVLAFPVPLARKAVGLLGGLAAIAAANCARLVLLYFAGAHSSELFTLLHEEVMVLLLIVWVCAVFVVWALWAA